MPSHGRAAPIGTALLLGVVAHLAGWPRRRSQTIWDRPEEEPLPSVERSPPPHRSFLSRWRVIVALAALAALGIGIAAGYRIRHAQKHREAAIALTGGDPERGAALAGRYGCGGCHTIPGVPGARGLVGPPLADIGRRVFVGGVVPNTPDALISWIVDPRALDPKTAMPVTGISRLEARDVAAYLYSLP